MSYRLLATAGLAVVGFVAYCGYFDYRRRSAPDFRRKLKERRARQQQELSTTKLTLNLNIPALSDLKEMQRFFEQHLIDADSALADGDEDLAAQHYAVAAICSPMPEKLTEIVSSAAGSDMAEKMKGYFPLVQMQITKTLIERGNLIRPSQ
ncbi:hypothetical protein ACOME3_000464 [Neoechinorhynchus agilis]